MVARARLSERIGPRKKRGIRHILWRALQLTFVLAMCMYLVFPCLALLSNAFKTQHDILLSRPVLITTQPTLANFSELFQDRQFIQSMLNSLKLALLNMLLVTLVAVPASYAIARIRSRSASIMQVWVLGSQMIPGIILLVPIYNILKAVGLNNKHGGLMLVYVVSCLPMTIWMLIGFIRNVPYEIEEAAFIDGCNIFQMIVRILLPTMLPGLCTALIMTFINTWNEYYFALCLIKDPNLQTMAIKLRTYMGLSGEARKGVLAAGSLIATLPGLLIFTFFSKFYIQGATAGSVKG